MNGTSEGTKGLSISVSKHRLRKYKVVYFIFHLGLVGVRLISKVINDILVLFVTQSGMIGVAISFLNRVPAAVFY